MADTNEVRAGSIWFCKIGEHSPLQLGADSPMRDAVAAEYKKLTGCEPKFIFSGWGGELTEGERAVVENREPVLEATPPADAALADESVSVVSGLRRANDLLRREGYHPEAFDFSKAADFIERIAAALRARAVPDGMALVPVEPTVEILRAAWRAHGYEDGDLITDDFDPRVIYRAMLAAQQNREKGQ